MKSKKILFGIAAAMFSIVLFAGCSCKKPEPPETTDPPEDNPPVVNPQSKHVTDYFNSTLKTKYYISNNNVTDQSGTSRSFTDLVERQIDVLANDILYRLVAVYGAGTEGLTTETGKYGEPAFGLVDPITGNIFTNGNKKALISNYELIAIPYYADSYSTLYKYLDNSNVTYSNSRLNEAVSYAMLLRSGIYRTEELLTTNLSNINAINGGYYWDETASFGNGGFNKALGFNENLNWNWNYDRLDIDVTTSASDIYSKYKDEYLTIFKTAIANILLSGNTTGKNYATAVNEIERLGYNETDKTKIKNFVLNEIIGSSLISGDNNRKPSVNTLTSETSLSEEEHYYKAYSLLVPEIVSRAFQNTFNDTSMSFWLNSQKTVLSAETNTSINSLTNKNFTSIKLVSKANTPLTKLTFSINGIALSNLTLTYTLYKNATTTISGAVNKTITNNSSGNFVLDLSAFNSQKLSADGFIEIKFANNTNSGFNVTFTGYYDKI